MATLNESRESTYQAFVTGWGATSVYTFGNEKFTPTPNTPWVRMVMQHQTGNQESLGGVGNRKFSREGIVSIQVFTPQDTGMTTSDTLVTLARSIFEGKTIDTIRFTDANVQEVGVSQGWYQVNIDINFAYDEVK